MPSCRLVSVVGAIITMQAAAVQKPVVAPMAARPSMAQRAAFKAAPGAAIARPTFSRTISQRAMKASRPESRVVVVRAADDKASVDDLGLQPCLPARYRIADGKQMTNAARWCSDLPTTAHMFALAPLPCRRQSFSRVATHPALCRGLPADGGDWPGSRLWLRQVHLHAPVSCRSDIGWRCHSCLAFTPHAAPRHPSPTTRRFWSAVCGSSRAGGGPAPRRTQRPRLNPPPRLPRLPLPSA